jgi:hypothetical protein
MDFGPVSDGGSLLPDQRWLNAYIMAQTVGFCNPVEHTMSKSEDKFREEDKRPQGLTRNSANTAEMKFHYESVLAWTIVVGSQTSFFKV